MVLKMGRPWSSGDGEGHGKGFPMQGVGKQVGAHRECAELVQDDWGEHGMGRNGSRRRFLKNITDNA